MLIRSFSLYLSLGLVFAAPASAFPLLTYSTDLRDSFTPEAIATDSSGNIYIAGNAIVDPTTMQTTVLIVKLNPKLNPQAGEYLYLRYLGGSVGDYANAVAVDAAGNAYVVGYTASPDFPVTTGGNLGTAASPAGPSNQRSFVAKLNPSGDLVFSDLLGGAAGSVAQAVAVGAAGQIVVSGTAISSGFPTTAGAYSIPNSGNHPYLLELDPTGMKTVFSATGIGGSAIALDSSGNIYMAGTTHLLDYPTTPGAYQTTFPAFSFYVCPGPICLSPSQGANQYATKVDPTGSKLIYSTAISPSGSGNTTNSGLAVDAEGSVYLTGLTGAGYPFSVSPPAIVVPVNIEAVNGIGELPFLSKLDPAGRTLLFSVPAGGLGVQVDSKGAVYVGGEIGTYPRYSLGYVTASLPALAGVPAACLAPGAITSSAYVSQVDAGSGNLLGSQYLGGSTLIPSGVALSGSTLWIAGSTYLLDFPFTPSAPAFANPGRSQFGGAYLGAVDFSQPTPAAGTPQIGCVMDAADLALAGPAAVNQVLTIFGTGLGPATGVSATDYSTTTLAGVSVNSGSISAPLLYVSANQINFAVPLVPSREPLSMQVGVNRAISTEIELPLTSPNPSLFLNFLQGTTLALNADGSVNAATNPAQVGSAISVFVNGLAPDPRVTSDPIQLFTVHGWSVTNIVPINPFVLRVDLQVPSALLGSFSCPPPSVLCTAGFEFYQIYGAGTDVSSKAGSVAGDAFGGVVYVNRGQ